jgi:hypothetical protein
MEVRGTRRVYILRQFLNLSHWKSAGFLKGTIFYSLLCRANICSGYMGTEIETLHQILPNARRALAGLHSPPKTGVKNPLSSSTFEQGEEAQTSHGLQSFQGLSC